MVIINVSELLVLKDIELDGEDVVVGIAVVGEVEEAEMLGRAGAGEAGEGDEEEGEAVAGLEAMDGGDREDERGREREGGVGGWFCGDFGREESSAHGESSGVVGEGED